MTIPPRANAVLATLRRGDTIAVVLLLIVGTLVAWVAEPRERTGANLDSYSTYDTKSGGYAAWYQLLRNERIPSATFEQHALLLDGSTGTLVYSEPLDADPRGMTPSDEDLASLEAWVRRGGHLVYLGHDDGAAAHGIFALPPTVPPTPAPKTHDAPGRAPEPRSLRRFIESANEQDADDARARRYRVSCACVIGGLAIAPELAALGIAHLAPHTKFRLFPPLGARLHVLFSDAKGALAATYPFGRGRVTMLLDETMFANRRIGHGDHGRLAVALANPGPVAFDETQHGYLVPQRWYDVVPRPFAIAIAISIAAILIAIAGASIRLGPPVVPFEREPTSSEFLDSLAGLFERNHAARASLDDAVTSVRRAVAAAVGLPATAPPEDVRGRLRTARDRDDFGALIALPGRVTIDDAALVRGLTIAQRLRKDYLHGRPRN